MSKDIKELLKNVESLDAEKDLPSLLSRLRRSLVMALVELELFNAKEAATSITSVQEKSENSSSDPEAIDKLAEICTTKTKEGSRLFLLHRPTEDYEYDKSVSEGGFTTEEETEWIPDYMTSEREQKGENPLVSCWVQEDSIVVKNPLPNTGTWGELGENPHFEKYRVSVKPGTYKIYQELKQ